MIQKLKDLEVYVRSYELDVIGKMTTNLHKKWKSR